MLNNVYESVQISFEKSYAFKIKYKIYCCRKRRKMQFKFDFQFSNSKSSNSINKFDMKQLRSNGYLSNKIIIFEFFFHTAKAGHWAGFKIYAENLKSCWALERTEFDRFWEKEIRNLTALNLEWILNLLVFR